MTGAVLLRVEGVEEFPQLVEPPGTFGQCGGPAISSTRLSAFSFVATGTGTGAAGGGWGGGVTTGAGVGAAAGAGVGVSCCLRASGRNEREGRRKQRFLHYFPTL